MPTTRRRHAITETEPVQAALDDLRRALGTDRLDLGELVVLGARQKLAAIDRQELERQQRRLDFAGRVRRGDLGYELDPNAAAHARRVRTGPT